MHAFSGCTRLIQDTCTLHQRKYRSVILITIKVLNIGTDRSDPDQTAPNYEQSDQGLHCFVIPPASFTRVNHNKVATCVALWGKKSTCQNFKENMNFLKFSTSSLYI